jgi:predicted nucleic acid-binding protein
MRVVFDTNVLLDYLMKRKPFNIIADQIFLLASQKKVEGFVTANSLTDIYYIFRKVVSTNTAKESILIMLDFLTIIDIVGNDCYSAFYHKIVDFEDALITVCAEKTGADYIITRDADFLSQNATVKVISPNDFMLIYDKT